MESISNSVWLRKGSAIIFDPQSLAPLIRQGALISLRQALLWEQGLPNTSPVTGRTLLIAGLETIVETMEPHDAQDFLVRRIRPLLIQLQNQWTETGVVFGFSVHPNSFEETSLAEEVLFRRRGTTSLRLSEGLWDGSATMNMKRIVRSGTKPGEEVTVGYYVARIS